MRSSSAQDALDFAAKSPLVLVQSADTTLYQHVDAKAARRIVEEHIVDGKKIEEHQIDLDGPFFSSQKKIVLENMGKINAESIEEYIASRGYEAFAKAVTEMKPEELIGEIRKAGLRGRGGAGYRQD